MWGKGGDRKREKEMKEGSDTGKEPKEGKKNLISKSRTFTSKSIPWRGDLSCKE